MKKLWHLAITGGGFVASHWYVVIKGQNRVFLRREDSLAMQEYRETITCIFGPMAPLIFSHSAKQKQKQRKRQKQGIRENLEKHLHLQ